MTPPEGGLMGARGGRGAGADWRQARPTGGPGLTDESAGARQESHWHPSDLMISRAAAAHWQELDSEGAAFEARSAGILQVAWGGK